MAERLERATRDRASTHGLVRRAFESCHPLGFSVEIESLGGGKEKDRRVGVVVTRGYLVPPPPPSGETTIHIIIVVSEYVSSRFMSMKWGLLVP